MFRSRCRFGLFQSLWRVLLLGIFTVQVGCASTSQAIASERDDSRAIAKNNRVEVSVKVLSFSEEAVHDDFSDGTSLSYRLAVLVVIGPKKYEGLKLSVAHYGDSWVDSVLAEVGRELNIEISEFLLSDSRVLIVPGDIGIISVGRVGDGINQTGTKPGSPFRRCLQ